MGGMTYDPERVSNGSKLMVCADNATPNQGGQVDVEESVVVEDARRSKLVR